VDDVAERHRFIRLQLVATKCAGLQEEIGCEPEVVRPKPKKQF
jgi:hypothetical protein